MKTVGKKLLSIVLILAGIFSILAALSGLKDCKAIQTYKELDGKEAERVSELEDAIHQLKDNEAAYAQGMQDYADGQIALQEGGEKLTSGQAEYDAGVKQLAEGKAAYAAGQKMIRDNTDAYNEGKEQLASIEPLLPMVDTYIALRDRTIAFIPGFANAQTWFAEVVAPMASQLGVDIPSDVTDFPGYIEKMVADGKAQIKQYEDGLAELAAAEKEIAAGEAKLAAAKIELENGYKDYESGQVQLADGKAQLDTFEDGMRQVNEFTELFFTQPTVYRHNGKLAIPNTQMRLGDDFNWEKTDANGQPITMMNGEPYLDLDKCLDVCQNFRQFYEEQVADVTNELQLRLGLYIALIAAGVLAIVSGILGLLGKGAIFGLITAIIAVAANIFGVATRYDGYTYPLRDMGADGQYLVDAAGEYSYTYSGTLQLIALLVIALAAVIFTVVAFSEKNAKRVER